MVAKADVHEALHQVHVGPAIALDEDRTIFGDCDVPADQQAVGKERMRADGKLLDLGPEWQLPSLDACAGAGMVAGPAETGVGAEVARAAETPLRKRHPAGE